MATDAEVVVRPGRRWPRRLLIGLNIFVALCLLATASGYLYIRHQTDRIGRIGLSCDVLRRCGDDKAGDPMNVLLVGSDNRSDLSKAEQKRFGSAAAVGGQRSDTMLVLHIDPKAEKASILSIPRDLYVPIAGTTSQARINSAFDKGPERLIQTIRNALGIEIDHYAEVDFAGFQKIVNVIGPVNVYFPAPARDDLSGLHQKTAGCIPLYGDSALSYVRSRHFELLENGRWKADPTGDLGRIQRQQDFVRRLMKRAISRGARNPIKLNQLIGAAADTVTLDKAFSTKDIVNVGKRFKSLEPDKVEMLTLPTTPASIGGAAVLRLKQPDAKEVVDRFNGVTPAAGPATTGPVPDIPTGSIRVRVLNGTGTSGQASQVAGDLSKEGFTVAGTGQADSYKYIQSVIRYGRGQIDKAKVLQAYVPGAQLREDLTLKGIDLAFVTGSEFQGVRNPTAAPVTTTTAPKTATTAKGTTSSTKAGKTPAPQPEC
ncbi:MAG TPA: LCP family protein [Acidimicrobiales bacterium]|nr:LCP family protein [Acidimicrobiales bacterium]